MKKKCIIAVIVLLSTFKAFPCGGDYEDYYYYYSLIFSQELINDPRYYPFLLSPDVAYYEADSAKVRNANIEEWQKYLQIPYEQAHYLVFKASKEDVQKLLSHKSVSDKKLQFANSAFTKKHQNALQYLYKAKELEPYMIISGHYDGWGYYEETRKDIQKLPYDLISLDMQKAWKQAKDKEIKLRYGYQLVRFAHYNRRYEEAIELFELYVEPLKLKSEMYYYALSQKAGAIRGTGEVIEANALFFEVFSHSADLKASALSSINLNDDVDYQDFLASAKTMEEKNDADLLLGYISFSDPLASARKIIQRSPDAIQAKVLTARAITFIEGDIKKYGDVSEYKDIRFPIIEKSARSNMSKVMDFVRQQAESGAVKRKNYWNIASAYLCYLDRNFDVAQTYLSKVDTKEEGYLEQRDILAMLIDVGREEYINSEVEDRIFAKYTAIFENRYSQEGWTKAGSFVMDLLSNRYYIQEDYAKSFMLLNSLSRLEENPNMILLNEIEELYNKSGKNAFEKYLTQEFRIGFSDSNEEAKVTVPQYIKHIKGFVYLTEDDTYRARDMFRESGYSGGKLSSDVFGYNQIECFECEENMRTDYLSDFREIEESMSELELTETIISLQKEAEGSGLKAAKANYLLGNFYYNTSVTGYFRNYLRFGYQSTYRQHFYREDERNDILENKIYLKDIPTYYENTVSIANDYLEEAYARATGDEFKARIVFALSKCEQEKHYETIINAQGNDRWGSYYSKDWVMISDREYFAELMNYKNTRFFKEVESNCMYFAYYTSRL